MKKIIIISAINIFEGGPLSILEDCLQYLSDNMTDKYDIIALVHDISLMKAKGIRYIEFNSSRKNWLYRLYYEYVYFYFISISIKPFLWFSLHDITPNVKTDIRAVYCHNPSPFCSFSIRSLIFSYRIALFSLFYKYLYRINIHKNNFVVVQQSWIRDEFRRMYDVGNVVVAYPQTEQPKINISNISTEDYSSRFSFFFPAFPRFFKNIEVAAEAAKILHARGRNDFKVIFTISGDENRYARHVVSKYKNVPVISFIGLQSKDTMFKLYGEVDALIFPSRLETWGLPISEFKIYRKPVLAANLQYARETVGDYEKVKFFDPDNPAQLAADMEALINGNLAFDGNRAMEMQKPFARNWQELFAIMLNS